MPAIFCASIGTACGLLKFESRLIIRNTIQPSGERLESPLRSQERHSKIRYHIRTERMMSTTAAAVTPERIMQFAWSYVPPLVLEAAIRHRVFDVLDAGPKTLKETAAATGASERGLRSIMNVLVGLNFLAKTDGQRYTLTPESETFLVSTKPGFQGGILRHASSQLIPKWLHLNEVVQTGKPKTGVNQEGEGSEFFQQFVADIFPFSYLPAQTLAAHLALGKTQTPVRVLDLA